MARTSVRALAAVLVHLGFRRKWASRAGGVWCAEYWKRVGEYRRVEVQLWGNGKHRATHWIFLDPLHYNGAMVTLPTPFRDAAGLRYAVARESTRKDNTLVNGRDV